MRNLLSLAIKFVVLLIPMILMGLGWIGEMAFNWLGERLPETRLRRKV